MKLSLRRADKRDDFALVAAVDAEVGFVGGKERVARVEFAHADEAEIGEVGMTVGIATSEVVQLIIILGAVECDFQHSDRDQSQYGLARS